MFSNWMCNRLQRTVCISRMLRDSRANPEKVLLTRDCGSQDLLNNSLSCKLATKSYSRNFFGTPVARCYLRRAGGLELHTNQPPRCEITFSLSMRSPLPSFFVLNFAQNSSCENPAMLARHANRTASLSPSPLFSLAPCLSPPFSLSPPPLSPPSLLS